MTDKKKEEAAEGLKDVVLNVRYFKFHPGSHHSQAGVHFTPLMGECEAGRIYPVHNPVIIDVLNKHDEWTSVAAKQYDSQVKADAKEQDDDEE